MFVFNREQLRVLDGIAAREFHQHLMAFLREEMQEETVDPDDDDLLSFIVEAETCAARHGIESDQGIAQYACLAMAAGPLFADTPRVAEFLKAPGTEPEQQLESLIDFMDLQLGE